MFLCTLAEFLQMDGNYLEARQVFDEALNDGGPTLHPLDGLLHVALKLQDEDAANDLLSRLRKLARDDQLDEYDYVAVAESLEEAKRYHEAMRWFTIPPRDIDPDDIDLLPIGCSNGRYRVRRALGLREDRYDEAAPLVREYYRATRLD